MLLTRAGAESTSPIRVIEASRTNDSAALASSSNDILVNSVRKQVTGPKITALFEPEQGALTIAEATAICGVDQFNSDRGLKRHEASVARRERRPNHHVLERDPIR